MTSLSFETNTQDKEVPHAVGVESVHSDSTVLATALYIVGGRQRKPRSLLGANQNWSDFEKAVILRLEVESGTAETRVEYVSPDEVAPSDGSILFKSGTISNGKLFICTQTEILIYSFPELNQLAYLTLPSFNDLHHVRPTHNGNLLVANSGLEMVMEVTIDGCVVRSWNTLGEGVWERFSSDRDYRKVNLKPHRSHPNYVFYLGEEPWATRFHQLDAVSLTRPDRRISINIGQPHDGYVHNNHIYFTTVNGKVVIVNAATLAVEEIIDLTPLHQDQALIGWCRGLAVDGNQLWIGYTRIRPTKWRENVSWVAHGFKRVCPTHVACYDLTRRLCIADFSVEDFGLNAIFSVFVDPEGPNRLSKEKG